MDEPPIKKPHIDTVSLGAENDKQLAAEGIDETGFLSNIDLFEPLPTELGIADAHYQDIRPTSAINQGSVIEFCVPAQGLTYYDLSRSLLYVRVKIEKINPPSSLPSLPEDDPPPPEAAGFINIPLHSLWRQVELSLQEVVITNGINTNYAYKSIIDVLTRYCNIHQQKKILTKINLKFFRIQMA